MIIHWPLLSGLLLLLISTAHAATTSKEAASAAASPSHQELLEAGKQIYLYGKLPGGGLLQGKVRQDVPLHGSQYACANCHRRSGIGSSEGGDLIPPIVGKSVFSPRVAGLHSQYLNGIMYKETRPAYTEASLGRLLREGIDPTGRELEALMPRFVLTDDEVQAIATYLASLTVDLPPGITEETIHFATITTEGNDAARTAMLAVLKTLFRDKNALTRNEVRRAAHAPFHKEWSYKSYRKWELHEWRLVGDEQSWPEQLHRYYAEQPVFIVMGGIGRGNWQNVHRFCEDQELPCLLPALPRPPQQADEDFYSIYFSRGVVLEAEALARDLSEEPQANARVIQVLRQNPSSRAAADSLRQALHGTDNITLTDVELESGKTVSAAFWHSLARQYPHSTWVLWLGKEDLAGIDQLAATPAKLPDDVYLSATLQGDISALRQHPLHQRFTLLSPYQPPGDDHNTFRFRQWAHLRKIPIDDLYIQSASFLAATLAGESLKHMHGNLSREYFIERIEHMMDNMINPSLYPRLSLAPGQRFAAKGCYVWNMGKKFDTAKWVVP